MSKFRSILPDDEQQPKPSFSGDYTRQLSPEEVKEKIDAAKNRPSRPQVPVKKPGGSGRRPAKRRKSSSVPFLFIFIIFMIILIPIAYNMIKQREKLDALQGKLEEQKQAKEKLEQSISALQDELDKVNTDEFIERYAHEKLGMVKPNEVMYELESSEGAGEEESDSESSTSEETEAESEEHPEEDPVDPDMEEPLPDEEPGGEE